MKPYIHVKFVNFYFAFWEELEIRILTFEGIGFSRNLFFLNIFVGAEILITFQCLYLISIQKTFPRKG
jgi:hypothetical protein